MYKNLLFLLPEKYNPIMYQKVLEQKLNLAFE